MKLFTILFLILLFSVTNSFTAQVANWSWARAGNSSDSGSDEAKSVTTDLSGNVIVTGAFPSASITFTSATTSLTLVNGGNTGTQEMWLAKYDPAGNLLWAVSSQGADHDQGRGVSTDAAGNVFVTGFFQSPSLAIGNVTLTNNSNAGLADGFIAKFSATGQFQWARSFGGALTEWGFDVAADSAGNSFVVGAFSSLSVSFGTVAVINSGGQDAYIVKFNPSGNALWAMQEGGSQNDYAVTADTDPLGNVTVGGSFESAALGFSPNIVNNGSSDVFVARYDGSGNTLFSFGIGGPGEEALWSLSTDMASNIYLVGTYTSNPLVIGTSTLVKTGQRDMFTAAYSATGLSLWANRNAGNVFSNPNAIVPDKLGNVYVSGFLVNLYPAAFGTTTLTSSTGAAAYIMRYNALTGADKWGTTFNTIQQDLAADNYNNIISAGYFGSTVTLGTQTLSGEVQGEAYIAKMCMMPASVSTIITTCPGITANYSISLPAGFTSAWYSAPAGGTMIASGGSVSATTASTFYLAITDTMQGCGFTGPRTAIVLDTYPLPTLGVLSGSIVALNSTSLNLQWYDCTYGSIVSGVSTASFFPAAPSAYALIYSIGSCKDTTDCFRWPPLGLDKLQKSIDQLYPNPCDNKLTLEISKEAIITIEDEFGRILFAQKLQPGKNDIEIAGLQAGLYFVGDGQGRSKICISR